LLLDGIPTQYIIHTTIHTYAKPALHLLGFLAEQKLAAKSQAARGGDDSNSTSRKRGWREMDESGSKPGGHKDRSTARSKKCREAYYSTHHYSWRPEYNVREGEEAAATAAVTNTIALHQRICQIACQPNHD